MIEIKNVDENGDEIAEIDWAIWRRSTIEEIMDADGKVSGIVSHCSRIPQAEIDATLTTELEQNLKSTDYISAKLGDSLLSCNSLNDILEVILSFKTKYGDVIEQRQRWRDSINEISNRVVTNNGS